MENDKKSGCRQWWNW